MGDALYFVATDRRLGAELFHVDPVKGGAGIVKDFNHRPASATAPLPASASFQGRTFFDANGLFASDGTADGTVLLCGARPERFAALGDTLYFTRGEGSPTLWKTDGTPEGTRRVKRFENTGANLVEAMIASGGALYLFAPAGSSGYPNSSMNVWRSDGTEAGTVQLPWSSGPLKVVALRPDTLAAAADGTLFYAGYPAPVSGSEAARHYQLWRSDGTPDGTYALALDPTGEQAVVGNTLVFRRQTPESGAEWWRTDGTAAGTYLLKDIAPGPGRQRLPGARQRLPPAAAEAHHHVRGRADRLLLRQGRGGARRAVEDRRDAGRHRFCRRRRRAAHALRPDARGRPRLLCGPRRWNGQRDGDRPPAPVGE